MSLTLKHTYRFDPFILDVDEQVLLRDGRMVPLTPKVFETLLLLVKHQGSIVTKQTILNTLWPDVFVEESNITFNITKLRKALGDTKRPSLYIETVPRRGYRFKTEVTEVLGEDLSSETTLIGVTLSGGQGRVEGVPATGDTVPSTLEIAGDQDAARPKSAGITRRVFSYVSEGRGKSLRYAIVAIPTLLAIAVAAGWRFNQGLSKSDAKSTQQIANASVAKPDLRFEQITAYGNVVTAAISPDGKQVVYVQENSGRQSLWLTQLAASVNLQLIAPGDAAYNKVSFSNAGDFVYFVKHEENEPSDLYRVPTLSGPPTKVLKNVEGVYSLSADDHTVVFRRRDRRTREDTLFIADLSNNQERLLVRHKEPDWIRTFSLSPNGKVVVYATGETDSARQTMSVREVNIETGQEKLLLKPNWYFIRQLEWLPRGDGLLLIVRETANLNPQIWRMSYPDGALQKLTNDLNNYLLFSLNSDASKVLAVQSALASKIWVSPNINANKAKNVADGRGRAIWTEDGRIIYNSASVLGSDLWIANPDGSNPKQLSFNAGTNDWPAISPDSRTIVFTSNRTGAQHLWRMDLDGSNQLQLTNGYAERNAAVSPDGKWVYYNSSDNNFLWKVGLNGGQPVKLTDEYAGYPSISPDGKLIACFHFPTYAHEARITVRNIDDMRAVAELTMASGFWISRSIQWESDSEVIYAIESKGKVKLYRQSLNGASPQELTTLKGEDEFEFALSPNHKELAYVSTKWNHDAVLIDGLK
jgi:Tol biopolymer transport system component/DNA-binding winged helix-turn-helix (wHTH) protein